MNQTADNPRRSFHAHGEFLTIATQERTSKQGSLKRNYGGVTTTRTRNLEAIERLREQYAQS